MPRVSREQTERNGSAIEAAASRLFREQGFKAVSVADLMAAAGLTHGGFYGHFASKDALVAVTCGQAYAQSQRRWEGRVAGLSGAAARREIIDNYLSPASVAASGDGCPATALATDVARMPDDAAVRDVYAAGLNGLIDTLTGLSNEPEAPARRRQALVDMAALVGAVTLARATQGQPIAGEVLDAVRRMLLDEHSTAQAPAA
jgi:TetR/AcrR family transcriptional repressor of nem operon